MLLKFLLDVLGLFITDEERTVVFLEPPAIFHFLLYFYDNNCQGFNEKQCLMPAKYSKCQIC